MSAKYQQESITYDRLEDGQDFFASEARQAIGVECMCKVVRHEARVVVSYLVEWPNGAREWRSVG